MLNRAGGFFHTSLPAHSTRADWRRQGCGVHLGATACHEKVSRFRFSHCLFKITLIQSPILSLEAIADPTRRRIVEMLAQRDRTVGEIVSEFDMSAPAISQHLKVLREAGLVNSRIEGQSRIQTLNPAGLDEIGAWLERTRSFWSHRLDALEQALRAEDERQRKKKKPTG